MRTIIGLTRWPPIAVQIETISGLRWIDLEAAPKTLRQAEAAHRAGRLLTARRREDRATYVVMKLP